MKHPENGHPVPRTEELRISEEIVRFATFQKNVHFEKTHDRDLRNAWKHRIKQPVKHPKSVKVRKSSGENSELEVARGGKGLYVRKKRQRIVKNRPAAGDGRKN